MAKKGQQGFTLLETLVAFSIIAISLGIFYSTFSTSLTRQAGVEGQIYAQALAENNLALVGESIPLKTTILEGSEEPYNWALTIVPRADPNSSLWLYQVISEVSWSGPAGERQISLETLKLGPEEDLNE